MVQGEKTTQRPLASSCATWDKTSRKSGFEAIQKRDEEKKKEEKKTYGSYGSTYKNKENFLDMHHW